MALPVDSLSRLGRRSVVWASLKPLKRGLYRTQQRMYKNGYKTKKCSQYTNLLVGFWIVEIDQGVYIQEGFEVSRCQKSGKFLCFT